MVSARMVARTAIDEALAATRRSFRQPADEETPEVAVSFDLAVASHEQGKLVLDVDVYVDQCEQWDQESAAILSQEHWWNEIATDLEKRLGVTVETGRFDMHW